MDNPGGDSSSYQTDQPQDYQYDSALDPTLNTQDDFSAQTNYYDSTQQDQYQSQFTDATAANSQNQQQQQPYQPQPQQQAPAPSQTQQQHYSTPPQATNQGYGAQPGRPSQFPDQSPQNNPILVGGPTHPAAYPPQHPQAFSPQNRPTIPTQQPVQFPPQSPIQPATYPPQIPQTILTQQPVQFPPQSPIHPAAYPPQNPQTIPTQQPVQFPPKSPQTNPLYQGGLNQPAACPPQGPQQIPAQLASGNYPPQAVTPPQAFPPQPGFTQVAYSQAPQPQAVSFPQQSPATAYNVPASPYKPAPQAAAPGFPVGTQPVVYNQGWRTGLFDCMDNPMNALITCFFPCLTFGQIAEIIDNGTTSCATSAMLYGLVGFFIGVPFLMSCGYRTKLRAKYGLVESPAPDWVTHFFCEMCAICQEYRELQLRGLDPAIGWQGNLAKQRMLHPQGVMMAPVGQTMIP